jgi:hypothetical protein
MRNAYKIVVRNFMGEDHLEELEINENILL